MLDYGRYTPYVLTAYGIAAAVLAGLIVWSVWRVGRARRRLEAIEPEGAIEGAAEKEKQS